MRNVLALLVLQGSEVFFDIFTHGSVPFHIVGKHQLSSTKRNVIQCHGKGKNSRQWAVSRVLTTFVYKREKRNNREMDCDFSIRSHRLFPMFIFIIMHF